MFLYTGVLADVTRFRIWSWGYLVILGYLGDPMGIKGPDEREPGESVPEKRDLGGK